MPRTSSSEINVRRTSVVVLRHSFDLFDLFNFDLLDRIDNTYVDHSIHLFDWVHLVM